MKRTILLTVLILSYVSSFGQNYSNNLQKYWWYRYRLVNDFMKVGLDFGESTPATGYVSDRAGFAILRKVGAHL